MRLFSRIGLVLLAASLTACASGTRAEPSPEPVPSEVLPPTSSPSPETPLAILAVSADLDKTTSDAYQKVVYDLAQQSGMRFQVRNSLSTADLEPGLRLVVVLPPDPGVTSLAAAAPQAQFLAINIPDVAPGGNISVLAPSDQTDVPAFLAGYTASIISDDFRAGMILPKDDPAAQQAARAFANGMAYGCGVCTSYRLYLDANGTGIRYPQYAEIPTDEDPARLGGWANYMVGSLKVDAIYVYPAAALEVRQLYDSLGQTGAKIMGASLPSPRPAGWVMTMQADAVKAIQLAWPDLVAGRGGQSVPSPLGLADVDPALLTPGKERLVQQVLADIQAGRIATGTGP